MENPEGEQLLYHYTNGIGLAGILQTKQLWASDSRFLNDALEVSYAADPLRKLVAELRAAHRSDGEPLEATRRSIFDLIARHLDPENGRYRAFVACFCESGDLLSQWRSYASDSGYAIGFSAEMLKQVPELGETHTLLGQVSYGLDEARARLEALSDRLKRLPPDGHPGARSHLFLLREFLTEVARVKHPTFSEEQEWRIVVAAYDPGNLKVSFRVSAIGVVPYVSLQLPDQAIRRTMVGPGRYPEVRQAGVRALLQRCGCGEVPVSATSSPLRV